MDDKRAAFGGNFIHYVIYIFPTLHFCQLTNQIARRVKQNFEFVAARFQIKTFEFAFSQYFKVNSTNNNLNYDDIQGYILL